VCQVSLKSDTPLTHLIGMSPIIKQGAARPAAAIRIAVLVPGTVLQQEIGTRKNTVVPSNN
jgi:hypothetical protein